MEIADYLGVSLDTLVYRDESKNETISKSDREWLEIISHIPKDKQDMCKDFLKTHMVQAEKYVRGKRA